jgi:hypothetical protein
VAPRLLAVAVMAIAATAMPAKAASPSVEAEHLPLLFNFGVTPSKLSAKKPTPARMSISWNGRLDDESPVPALRRLKIEADRNLDLDLAGVPVCRFGPHYDIRPSDIEERCRDAAVGHGRVGVEVRFPEEPAVSTSGKLTVYNLGRKAGGVDLLAHFFLSAPVVAEIVFPIKVRRAAGRYGWKAQATIPKIAGGSGSITDYSLRIGRRVLCATCPDGKLLLRATSVFLDGTVRRETAIRTCTVAEADPRQ